MAGKFKYGPKRPPADHRAPHVGADRGLGKIAEVQGDGDGEIRNGYPVKPYLPKDPGRRERLLAALEILRKLKELQDGTD